MRRRRSASERGDLPARLARFDAREWPAATWAESFDAWRAALAAHAVIHGGPDPLYRFMLAVRERRRAYGEPLPIGVSHYFRLPVERGPWRSEKRPV